MHWLVSQCITSKIPGLVNKTDKMLHENRHVISCQVFQKFLPFPVRKVMFIPEPNAKGKTTKFEGEKVNTSFTKFRMIDRS